VAARLATIHARKRASPAAAAAEVGLTAQELADVRTRCRGRPDRLLNRIAEALDDDMLGFHLALKLDLRQPGCSIRARLVEYSV
jgi:hypothetical protein